MKKVMIIIISLMVTFFLYADVKLKLIGESIGIDANVSKYLTQRDVDRLNSGLLNRIIFNYQLEDKRGEGVNNGQVTRLLQYDLWKKIYVIKTVSADRSKIDEYSIVNQDVGQLFTSFENVLIAQISKLMFGVEYRVVLKIVINPLTEKQILVAKKQLSKNNFSGLSTRKSENINLNKKGQEKNHVAPSLPFLDRVINAVTERTEEAIVIESNWVKL